MRSKLLTLALMVLAFAVFTDAQTVTVTKREVTYKRPKGAADHKKTFTVTYPVIKAKNAAVSRKIATAVSYKTILDLDIAAERDKFGWLDDATFDVDYNKNGILSMSLTMEGSAAYPSGTTRHVVVDTLTGIRVKPASVFTNIPELLNKIRSAQTKEIEAAKIDIRNDPENSEEDVLVMFRGKTFAAKDLDGFFLTDTGVTFVYSYDFPHVVRAWEPDGQYRFSWDEIRQFVKKGSLLERALR